MQTKQNKRHHKSNSMLISSEKHHESYKKTLNSRSQKTMFLSIFISQKIMFSDIFISESMMYSSLNFSKKNMTILSLIKDIQEFDSQCRQISSQLHEKLKENFSFV